MPHWDTWCRKVAQRAEPASGSVPLPSSSISSSDLQAARRQRPRGEPAANAAAAARLGPISSIMLFSSAISTANELLPVMGESSGKFRRIRWSTLHWWA